MQACRESQGANEQEAEPMIPVDQTMFRPSEGDGAGNCLAACIASVLELPLEDVPNFAALSQEEWFTALQTWLRDRGLGIIVWSTAGQMPYLDPDGADALLAQGKSPRGDWRHTVVVDAAGELLHDPHPSRDGVEGISEVWLIYGRLPAAGVARRVVDEQARDWGLWFDARTAPEAYLQQELRRLHGAVESGVYVPAPD